MKNTFKLISENPKTNINKERIVGLTPAESVLNTKSAVQKKTEIIIHSSELVCCWSKLRAPTAYQQRNRERTTKISLRTIIHRNINIVVVYNHFKRYQNCILDLWLKNCEEKKCWYFVNSKLSFGRYRCSASRTYYKSSVTWIAKVRSLNITT